MVLVSVKYGLNVIEIFNFLGRLFFTFIFEFLTVLTFTLINVLCKFGKVDGMCLKYSSDCVRQHTIGDFYLFVSEHRNTDIEGSVLTIILSQPERSEMMVKNIVETTSVCSTRPVDKRPKHQEHRLHEASFQLYMVQLPEK